MICQPYLEDCIGVCVFPSGFKRAELRPGHLIINLMNATDFWLPTTLSIEESELSAFSSMSVTTDEMVKTEPKWMCVSMALNNWNHLFSRLDARLSLWDQVYTEAIRPLLLRSSWTLSLQSDVWKSWLLEHQYLRNFAPLWWGNFICDAKIKRIVLSHTCQS